MEDNNPLTLIIAVLALILSIITAYKTFWEYPNPVFSIKTQIIGTMTQLGTGNERIPYIFFEGILLNSNKKPLIPKAINLRVVHEGKWINLTHIYIENGMRHPIGNQVFVLKKDAENYDLMKVNAIVTSDNPQYFYAQFNIPNETLEKIVNRENVNLRFVITDGFGKEYNYIISTEGVEGVDLSKPSPIFRLASYSAFQK